MRRPLSTASSLPLPACGLPPGRRSRGAGVLLALLLFGCGTDRGDADARLADRAALWTEESSPPIERVVEVAEWDTVVAIGGPNDTLLSRPGWLRAEGGRLYVFDGIDQRVLAFDDAGRLRWTWGRQGAGPGELRGVRDMRLDAQGNIVLLDADNLRITLVSPTGQLIREIPIRTELARPEGIVPLPRGEYLLWTLSAEAPFVRLGPAGEEVARHPFPWAGFAELPPMATQGTLATDPSSGRFAFAFAFGNGFFLFDEVDGTPVVGRFVEHTPWPTIATTGDESRRTTGFTERPIFSAADALLSDSVLSVLFVGRSPGERRMLDRFSAETGAYIGSWQLPFRTGTVAEAEGIVYAVVNDPFPGVIGLRPAGAGSP